MNAEIQRGEGQLRLRNDQVELVLEEATGQVQEIWNRRLNWNFKTSPGGAWPLSYWIRHPVFPWWGGRPKHLPPCAEEYVGTPAIRTRRAGGGTTLTLDCPELAVIRRQDIQVYPGVLEGTAAPEVLADREMSGVRATVEIRLPDGADYFLMRATVDLRGSRCDVVRFGSGLGGALRADADPEHERIAAPEWFGGAVYDNPRDAIQRKERVGRNMVWPYLGGATNSLTCGWVDYYGRRGGLGLGYLGKSGHTVAFEAAADGEGLSLNWRTFDLSGVQTYFADHAPGFAGVYPLEAGRKWTSDWWIVAPHEGDWHRMADIYRDEHRKAFAGEYLEPAQVSPAARDLDLLQPAWFVHGAAGRHFDGFADGVRKCARAAGLDPRHVLVWLIGTQDEGFDTTFPDFFPMHKTCGGEEAAARSLADLRRSGFRTFDYTNPSFNHTLAKLYVPEADTGIRANHGNFACFASPAWLEMWREKLVPRLLAIGACGIQLDQWPLQFCPCRRKGHGHRTDSAAALSGQAAGKRRWLRALRDALVAGEPEWFFFSESGADVVGGLVDIWTFGLNAVYAGGRPTPELTRFTHPQYVMTSGLPLLDALIAGFVTYLPDVGPEGREDEPTLAFVAKPEFQQFRRVRGELRQAKAPGFPQGFRDTLGLSIESPSVRAKAYTAPEGVTVVFYAQQDVDTVIAVEPTALGHAGAAAMKVPVRLRAGEAGWWCWRA